MKLKNILNEITKPKILYHAGPDKITKLDSTKIKGGARATIGWGVYFTSSKDKAMDYGKEITTLDSSKIRILNMDNPVTQEFVDDIRKMSDGVPNSDAIRKYKLMAFSDYFKSEIGKDINTARKNVLDRFTHNHESMFLDILKYMGYDAVSSGYEYSIFDMEAGTNALIKGK